LFLRVTLLSVSPDIFTAMRVGIGVAWGTLVAAELIAASVGLGWLANRHQRVFDNPACEAHGTLKVITTKGDATHLAFYRAVVIESLVPSKLQ
jgi:hypothetical protein